MKILCTENQLSLFEDIEGYKPVKGSEVETDNKKNNSQYYKEAEKKAKDYDGGLKDDTSDKLVENEYQEAADINSRGMERLKYDAEPTKTFKDKVNAQIMGKASEIAEDIDDETSGESTKGNEKFLNKAKKMNKMDNDNRGVGKDNRAMVQLGDDIELLDEPAAKKPSAFESKMKRYNFSKTSFIDENHVLSLVSESMKNGDEKFLMRDKDNKTFMVENRDGVLNIVLDEEQEKQKQQVNEQMSRMKNLWNYNSRPYFNAKSNRGDIDKK